MNKYIAVITLLLYGLNVYSEYEVGEINGFFNVNEMGAATYSFPFDLPEGINGMQPSLGLAYNSQGGNGVAGMGTSISGLSVITRVSKDVFHDGKANGVSYSTADAYAKDGVRLLLKSGTEGTSGAKYNAEGMPYNDITLISSGKSQYFIVDQPDGSKAYYGSKTTFSVSDIPSIWYLDKIVDVYGNTILYNYTTHGGCVYISNVVYGTNESITGFSEKVSFAYTSRNDTIKSIYRGVQCNMSRLLSKVTITTTQSSNTTTWYEYNLTYQNTDGFSRLKTITKKYGDLSLPPVTFTWNTLPGLSPIRSNLTDFGKVVAKDGNGVAQDICGNDRLNQYFFTGNFLANGKEDLIVATFYNGKTCLNIYEYGNNGKFLVKSFNEITVDPIDYRQLGSYVGDINGDGYSEIILPYTNNEDFFIYTSDKMKFWDEPKSMPGAYLVGTNDVTPLGKLFSEKLTTKCTPVHTIGDFYNKGKMQVIYVETQLNSNSYPAKYTCKLLMKKDDQSTCVSSFNMDLPLAPRRLIVSDFNGDGMQDLMVLFHTGYKIYVNQSVSEGNMPFSESKYISGTVDLHEEDNQIVQTGDFNGDGILDFLTEMDGDNNWYFYFGNGNGTFTKRLACSLPNCTNKSYTERDNDKLQCYVTDFNNDGKQDVIIIKAFYEKKTQLFPKKEWGEYKETYIYWMKSTGYSLTEQKRTTTSNVNDATPAHFAMGDFDGDGFQEFINYGSDIWAASSSSSKWNLYDNTSLTAASNKVSNISIPNYGTETKILYASLSDGNVYKIGTDSKFPLIDVTLPLHVVKQVTLNAGGTSNVKTYGYKELRMHTQGRGLLGFSTTTVRDESTGMLMTESVISLDANFYIPKEVVSITNIMGYESSSRTTMTRSTQNGKNYFVYPSKIEQTDIYGNKTTTTNTYNTTYGYLTQQKTIYGTSNMYKQTTYSSYVKTGGIYKPRIITTTQKHKDAGDVCSIQTNYTYSENGKIATETEYANSTPNYHFYTYDAFGNMLTHKIWAAGIDTIATTYKYDATHRLVLEEKSSASDIKTAYTYNSIDLPTKVSKILDGSTIEYVQYTYDALGRKVSEKTYPQVSTTSYTYGWGGTASKRYFVQTQTTACPLVKTWYDNLGRTVATESRSEKNIQTLTQKSYDSQGNLYRKTTTTGNISTDVTYVYDLMNRLINTRTNTGSTVLYNYANKSITITDNGRKTEKTYDEWGNIKKITDLDGSTVEYFYNSNGKANKIVADGAQFLMTYDAKGQQTSLTDPDAGKTTYSYDAIGRVVKQVDNRGTVTSNTYDKKSGLLTKTVCGNITTSYTYDSQQRLTQETSGNESISYEYNTKNQLTRKTIKTGDKSFVFRYFYNSLEQLSSMWYPDNTSENYYYDANGNIERVMFNGQKVWELTDYTGTTRKARLGNDSDSLFRFEFRNADGFLSYTSYRYKSRDLNNIGYTFDKQKNLLLKRNSMLTGRRTEEFSYDSHDRLVETSYDKQYFFVDYDSNGNITNKSDVGSYSYESNRPHAVTEVENTGGAISEIPQYVTYTPFNKVQTIEQGEHSLMITYGPDQQRCKTVLRRNDTLLYTRYYADTYEEVHSGNDVYRYYYVYTPDGLSLVAERINNTINVKNYHVETDYLGSIVAMYNYKGQTVFRAEYDAWGKQNVVTDNLARFQRGYCGHEHWQEFGLIDMNGRMYDPVIARFLSPDPFVQAPEDLQNYNRYSYCLNNPLKYTDPSGELAWEAIVIGAIVGGITNVCVASKTSDSGGGAYFFAGAVVGAVSGLCGGTLNVSGILPGIAAGAGIGGVSGMASNASITILNNCISGIKWNSNLASSMWNGFVSGAISGGITGGINGYNIAKSTNKNYWWGNDVKYGRKAGSFWDVEKPYYSAKWNINEDVGCIYDSENCVPTTFAEIEDYFGGNRSYEDFVNISGYIRNEGTNLTPQEYSSNLLEVFSSRSVKPLSRSAIFDTSNMQELKNGIVSVYQPIRGHVDNIRQIDYYLSGKVKIRLRDGIFNLSKTSRWNFYMIK